MTPEQGAVRVRARRLFDETFRAAGWTDEDFRSFNGWAIREAIIAIAAGGEQAAVEKILAQYGGIGAMPRLDPATGTITNPLLDRCMDVIREARD